jgi:hypothetical protein
MARIPESELERLKNEVSVERLVEASGVVLKRGGKDWLGRCPFHEDDTASLVVSPGKNLCFFGSWPCWASRARRSARAALTSATISSSLIGGMPAVWMRSATCIRPIA